MPAVLTVKHGLFLSLFTALFFIAACTSTPQADPILITLVADGRERVYRHTEPITVGQFLREVGLERAPLDRVEPSEVTQIRDGMRITVVRVVEEEECESVEIPYRQQVQLFEGIAPGDQRIGQAGRNGAEQVCYRISIVDGVRGARVEQRRTITIEPQDEIIYVGPTTELEPVPVSGTLAYISNSNVWIINGSSRNKRILTDSGDLDRRVFSLSPDGQHLLIARSIPANSGSTAFNQLWLITNINSNTPQLVPLSLQDVLFAEWAPGRVNTISYSTAQASDVAPGWNAYNDFWLARIDINSGEILNLTEVLPRSTGGLNGWWGTRFQWSPNGDNVAWIRANSIGLIDFENNDIGQPLVSYPLLVVGSGSDWSWRTTVSWSPDASILITTTHGPPLGSEAPEASPVFNITAAAVDGSFQANLVERAGIWSTPKFSPEINVPGSQFPRGYIAYLRAREWENSITSDYDLVIADRDGSNERVIFPQPGQPGLVAERFAQDFTWSPDGSEIAFIYQGNLWIIDVASGVARPLTQDGGASRPVWAR